MVRQSGLNGLEFKVNNMSEENQELPKVGEADPCLRCLREMTIPELTLASEDSLHYCVQCREAVAQLRTAVNKAYGGRFRTGV